MSSNGLLDGALAQFNAAIASAYPTLMTYAQEIWFALVVIEIGIVLWQAGKTHDVGGMMRGLMTGLICSGVSLVILEHALEWGLAAIHGGEQIALAAGGISPTAVTPSGIIDQGFAIVGTLWNHVSLGTWLIHTSDAAALYIAGFITAIAFFAAALVYFFTLLFTTFSVAWGCLVLGFAALEWTWPILLRWVNDVLALTIKLAVILLIVGAGMAMINLWAGNLNAGLTTGRGIVWNYWATIITLASALWFGIIFALPRYLSNIVAVTWLSPHEGWLGRAAGAALGVASSVASAGTVEVAKSAGEIAGKVRESLLT